MNVINARDIVPRVFAVHGGIGEIEMKFALSEDADADDRNWHIFGIAHFPPGTSAGLHLHESTDEFFYVLSGSALIVVDEAEWRISEGDIVLTRSGSRHEIRDVADDFTMIVIEVRSRV